MLCFTDAYVGPVLSSMYKPVLKTVNNCGQAEQGISSVLITQSYPHLYTAHRQHLEGSLGVLIHPKIAGKLLN